MKVALKGTGTGLAVLSIVATALLTSAWDARAGWTESGVPFDGGGSRGVRAVTMTGDGNGGMLLRWVALEGMIYWPYPTLGHLDPGGDYAPGWPGGSKRFVDPLASDPLDLVAVPDGSGGAIVVTVARDSGGVRAFHLRGDGASDPDWPEGGLTVCAAPSDQTEPRSVSDGDGGAFALWADDREGTETASAWALYLSHVTADGTVASGWPADGKRLTALPADYSSSRVKTLVRADGAGGAYVAVFDPGARLFRFTAGGTAAPGWPDAGLAVGPTPGSWPSMVVASEGSVYLAWPGPPSPATLLRPCSLGLLRVTSGGALAPGWSADGIVLASGPDSLSDPAVVPDAAGGAYVAWASLSTPGALSLRALHVDADGIPLSGWPAAGLDLLGVGAAFEFPNRSYSGYDYGPSFAVGTDGTGGLLAAWNDVRVAGTKQVRATRVQPGGERVPSWPDSGRLVHKATQNGLIRAIEGDGAGGAFVAWEESFSPFGSLRLSRLQPDGVVPVLVSLLGTEAEDGCVRVRWFVAEPGRGYEVERSVDDGAWRALRSVSPDAGGLIVIEDRDVAPGARLRYRLSWTENGVRVTAGEATVAVPLRPLLALSLAGTNPVTGELALTCTLGPGAPASLELLDLSGRRLRKVDLDPGPARRVVLARAGEVPGGVLFARLTQAGSVRVRRVVFLR